jgi:hypothetical protein
VRQKWVGLDLPVMRYAAHREFLAFGVLSIPRSERTLRRAIR